MKNKLITLMILLIGVFIMIGGSQIAYADICSKATCGGTLAIISDRVRYSSTQHGTKAACMKCNAVYWSNLTNHTWSLVSKTGCEAKYECTGCEAYYYTDSHTWGSYVKVDDKTCKRTCSVCSTTQTKVHEFTNNTCVNCGYTIYPYEPTSSTPSYYALKNPTSSNLTVTIKLTGASSSSSGSSRKITFTDTIPAGVTRVYTYYIASFSLGNHVYLGYYDLAGSTAGTNKTLAIIAPWYSSAKATDLGTTGTYVVKIPTSISTYATWTAENGTSRTIARTINESISLNTAVNSSGKDYVYNGVQGASGVTKETVSGKCTYGSVEIIHTCSYTTTYTSTANTHTLTKTCQFCGKTATESSEKHTWNTSHKCTICGYQGTHSYSDYVTDVAATCIVVRF